MSIRFRSPLPFLLVAALALATANCSKDAKQYFESGNKYFAQQKYREAALEYQNAIKKDQKYADARLKLADTYVALGDPRNAGQEYVRAADLLPNNLDAQLKAGTFLALAGRYEDAGARADAVLAKKPRNVDALILKGNIAARLQDLDGAVKQMEEAIRIDPKATSARTNLGVLQTMKGDAQAAERTFLQAVDADPKSVNPRLALGNLYMQTNRPTDAEAAFKAAYTLDPKNVLSNRALASFYLVTDSGCPTSPAAPGCRTAEAEPYLKTIADTTKAVGASLALANYYAGTKRVPEAIALLDKLSANKAAYGAAKTQMARLQWYAEKRQADANKTIDEVLAKEPKNDAALLVKAQFLLQEKRVDEALAKTQAAVAANPRSAEAHYLLGVILLGKNDSDQARAEFNEVLKINPRVAAAQTQLARIELAKGRDGAPGAVQFAEQAVTNAPRDLLPRLMLVRSLAAKGDVSSISRADSEMKNILQQLPNVSAVQTTAGMLQAARKDYAGARKSFERALQLNPGDTEAIGGLVQLDVIARKPADARRRVEERLAVAPNDPAALLLAGATYGATGDAAREEQLLLKAIEVAPNTMEAYNLLGRVYLQQGKLDQARQRFEQMAKLQPKPVAPLTMVAMIFEMQGKRAEAQKRYEKVLEIDRTSPVAANNLAWIYAEGAGSIDSALQLAQVAKAKLPDQPEVNDTLGWIYVKKDMAGLAVAPLKQAVDKAPTNPVYHYHLGVAYSKIPENKATAKAHLETALKLSPNFDGAAEARKVLEGIK